MTAIPFFIFVSLALTVSAANFKRVACPDGKNTATNAACCAFFSLRDDMLANLFDEGCSEEVHESLRLVFHDAIGISPALTAKGKFGGTGADGSPLLFPGIEPNFRANLGIIDAVDFLTPFLHNHNVTAADLVQFAGALGMTQCQGAPALEFMAGRPNAQQVPPDGLVPDPNDSVDKILARFDDAGGFTADDVVALLASHSVARADHVDPTLAAAPFDTTPFTFDTQFFLETQLRGTGFPGKKGGNRGETKSPLPLTVGDRAGEIRLKSDNDFARDSRTACLWQSFVTDQQKMSSMFAASMAKLAILGQNRADLVDCSEVLPPPAPPVTKPPTFPATKSNKDIEQACEGTPFPTLSTDPGPATIIPHCPDGLDNCGT